MMEFAILNDLIKDWRENSCYAFETGDIGASRAWDRAIADLEAKIEEQ